MTGETPVPLKRREEKIGTGETPVPPKRREDRNR
jgi:hypothetical protein